MVTGDLDRCREWISAALEYSGGTHDIIDIYEGIYKGTMQLWPSKNCCIVTELIASAVFITHFLSLQLFPGKIRMSIKSPGFWIALTRDNKYFSPPPGRTLYRVATALHLEP